MERDDYLNLSAKLSTHKFLLGQLYAQLFLQHPASLATLPASMIDSAKFTSTSKGEMDDETKVEIQSRVVLELESFFNDVERRVAQAQGR